MNERDFFYWLQGYFELSGNEQGLSAQQVKVIKEHMALVAEKKTASAVVDIQSLFDARPMTMLCSSTLESSGSLDSLVTEAVQKMKQKEEEDYKQLPLFNVPTPITC